MNGLRGPASVIAGFILMTVLVMFVRLGLPGFWTQGAESMPIVVGLAISVFLAAVSAFVTVRFAPAPKMRWVSAYAGSVLIVGIAYGVSNMGGARPDWYLLSLPVLGAAAIYVGGKWYADRRATDVSAE